MSLHKWDIRHRDRQVQREGVMKTQGEDGHVTGVKHLQAKELQGLQATGRSQRR